MVQTAYLAVEGMHCASCSGRVERVLRAVPGVDTAAVNLATNSATVGFADGKVEVETLIAAVTAAGYAARLPTPDGPSAIERTAHDIAALRTNTRLALALALPVVALAMGPHMVPALHHLVMATIGEQASTLSSPSARWRRLPIPPRRPLPPPCCPPMPAPSISRRQRQSWR